MQIYHDRDTVILVQTGLWGIFSPGFKKKCRLDTHYAQFFASNCFIAIQGVSRLVDNNAGGDFLGLCDQKSSYKHVYKYCSLVQSHYFL